MLVPHHGSGIASTVADAAVSATTTPVPPAAPASLAGREAELWTRTTRCLTGSIQRMGAAPASWVTSGGPATRREQRVL